MVFIYCRIELWETYSALLKLAEQEGSEPPVLIHKEQIRLGVNEEIKKDDLNTDSAEIMIDKLLENPKYYTDLKATEERLAREAVKL